LLFSDILAAPANEHEVNIVGDIAERGERKRSHFEQSTMAWMATAHWETGTHPADRTFVLTARQPDSALHTTHAGLASVARSWCRAELIEL